MIKNLINLLLTKLTIENLKNLLIGKFELRFSFDISLIKSIRLIIFAINFSKKFANYSSLTNITKIVNKMQGLTEQIRRLLSLLCSLLCLQQSKFQTKKFETRNRNIFMIWGRPQITLKKQIIKC